MNIIQNWIAALRSQRRKILLDCRASLAMTANITGLQRFARKDGKYYWIAALRSQRR